jgi:hypothetical protein
VWSGFEEINTVKSNIGSLMHIFTERSELPNRRFHSGVLCILVNLLMDFDGTVIIKRQFIQESKTVLESVRLKS